jgi:hypothetical protein
MAGQMTTKLPKACYDFDTAAGTFPGSGRPGEDTERLTSSIVLKGEDSSRDARSRCWFAVHWPGNPEASPRSHRMPCGGITFKLSGSASLVLAGMFDYTTIEGRERRFLPSLKAGASTPQTR